MPERICLVGLGVNTRQTAGAGAQLGIGEVFKAQIRERRSRRLAGCKHSRGRSGRSMSGPDWVGLARVGRAGIEMMVCAPGGSRASPEIGSRPTPATR